MNAIGGKWFKIKQADSDQNRDVVNCHVSLFQSQACLTYNEWKKYLLYFTQHDSI